MGSAASSDERRRGVKGVVALKALQRISNSSNLKKSAQQDDIHHQAAASHNNSHPSKQLQAAFDFNGFPQKTSTTMDPPKQTQTNGNAVSVVKTDKGQTVQVNGSKPQVNGGDGAVAASGDSNLLAGVTQACKESVAMARAANVSGAGGDNQSQSKAGESNSTPVGDGEKNEKEKEYTEEEWKVKIQESIDRVTGIIEKFKDVAVRDLEEEGQPFTKACRNNLLTFAQSYFFFKVGKTPWSLIYDYRQTIAKSMLEHKTVTKLCGILEDELTRRTFLKADGDMDTTFWLPLKNCMLGLLNYSDASDDVKIDMGACPTAFKAMVKLLEEWKDDHQNEKLSDNKMKCLKWCMSLLHNAGGVEENVPILRECGTTQAIIPYMDSPYPMIRLSAVSTLADLVNEEEAELLQTHTSSFKFIIKVFRNSLQAENHKHLGWSALELAKAIRQLARNDINKKILVDEGCLPLLVMLVNTGNKEEIKESINCLWVLSFKQENKMKMVQESGLVHCLEEKFNATEDGSLRHSCHGVLWSLRDQINSPESHVNVGEAIANMVLKPRPVSASRSKTPLFNGHVMVSYQWGNQELIKRIVQELRARDVPVWLDIDYMGGSTLQAMAQAVEDSTAVIIAMSQKYKDSPNTRAEAEYAFQQRKKIIPLIMQRDYRPDGWLGFILGSKLYYDFSGRYPFESRMDGLLKAVLELKQGGADDILATEVPTVATKKDETFALAAVLPPVGKSPTVSGSSCQGQLTTFDLEAVKKWTADDKNKWLSKHNMKGYTKLSAMTGEEIVFLHNLKTEAPEFFYRCLETKLAYDSLLDLSKVSAALADLST